MLNIRSADSLTKLRHRLSVHVQTQIEENAKFPQNHRMRNALAGRAQEYGTLTVWATVWYCCWRLASIQCCCGCAAQQKHGNNNNTNTQQPRQRQRRQRRQRQTTENKTSKIKEHKTTTTTNKTTPTKTETNRRTYPANVISSVRYWSGCPCQQPTRGLQMKLTKNKKNKKKHKKQ